MTDPLAALGYDPRSPDFRRDPYPTYRRLQQEAPRFYDAEKRLWVLSRYEDVRFVLHDPRFQFTGPMRMHRFDDASFHEIQAMPASTQRFLQQRRKATDLQNRFLDMRHPPEHTVLRQLVQPWFQPTAIRETRTSLHERAHALIDGIVSSGTPVFDLVQQFALPLEYGALCQLLGIAESMSRELLLLPRAILQATDFNASAESIERAAWATHRLALHFDHLMSASEMLHPSGLLERLSKSSRSGDIHNDDALSLAIMLFAAGYETSSSALGLAVRNLLLHRTAWQELHRAHELIPSAVEELLRFEGTIQARPHAALEDVDASGWHIRRGDRFQLLIGAANRDPESFDRPDELVLDRNPNPHLAFFHGLHYCIGAPLARLTLQVSIAALLERMPDLQLIENGETWLPTYFAHGFERLLVTYETP